MKDPPILRGPCPCRLLAYSSYLKKAGRLQWARWPARINVIPRRQLGARDLKAHRQLQCRRHPTSKIRRTTTGVKHRPRNTTNPQPFDASRSAHRSFSPASQVRPFNSAPPIGWSRAPRHPRATNLGTYLRTDCSLFFLPSQRTPTPIPTPKITTAMSFARTARPLARALCSSPLATARFSSRPSLLAARNITPVATQLPLKAPRIETEGKPAALAAGKKKAGKGSPETKVSQIYHHLVSDNYSTPSLGRRAFAGRKELLLTSIWIWGNIGSSYGRDAANGAILLGRGDFHGILCHHGSHLHVGQVLPAANGADSIGEAFHHEAVDVACGGTSLHSERLFIC